MSAPVLIVPGWGDSGPEHWQTLWERAHPDFRRVSSETGSYPVCAEWVETLDAASPRGGGAAVLVAHSLGCIAVAHCGAPARCPSRPRCWWCRRTSSTPTSRP